MLGVLAEYGLGIGVAVMLVKSFVGVGMLVVSVESLVLLGGKISSMMLSVDLVGLPQLLA